MYVPGDFNTLLISVCNLQCHRKKDKNKKKSWASLYKGKLVIDFKKCKLYLLKPLWDLSKNRTLKKHLSVFSS